MCLRRFTMKSGFQLVTQRQLELRCQTKLANCKHLASVHVLAVRWPLSLFPLWCALFLQWLTFLRNKTFLWFWAYSIPVLWKSSWTASSQGARKWCKEPGNWWQVSPHQAFPAEQHVPSHKASAHVGDFQQPLASIWHSVILDYAQISLN